MKKYLLLLGMVSIWFAGCNSQPSPFENRRPPNAVIQPTLPGGHSVYPDFMALAKACHGGECITQGRLLLADQADLEIKDEEGWTPLLRAISEQKVELLQFLLSSGANPNVLTKKLESSWSLALMHYPASEPALNALLDAKGDPNLMTSESLGVQLVSAGVSATLFKKFMDAGLDLSKSMRLPYTHAAGEGSLHFKGATPLFAAAYQGRLTLLQLLMSARAPAGSVELTRMNGERIFGELSLLDAAVLGMDGPNRAQDFKNVIFELENQDSVKATDQTLYAAALSYSPLAVDFMLEHLKKDPTLSLDHVFESGESAATAMVTHLNYERLLKFKGMTFRSLAARYPASPGASGGVLGELLSNIEALFYARKSALCTVAVVSKYFPEALNPASPIESPLFAAIGTANMRNLIRSVRNDAAHLAALMVTCGANPKLKDASGKTALERADRVLSPYIAAIEPGDAPCAKVYADYRCESAEEP